MHGLNHHLPTRHATEGPACSSRVNKGRRAHVHDAHTACGRGNGRGGDDRSKVAHRPPLVRPVPQAVVCKVWVGRRVPRSRHRTRCARPSAGRVSPHLRPSLAFFHLLPHSPAFFRLLSPSLAFSRLLSPSLALSRPLPPSLASFNRPWRLVYIPTLLPSPMPSPRPCKTCSDPCQPAHPLMRSEAGRQRVRPARPQRTAEGGAHATRATQRARRRR